MKLDWIKEHWLLAILSVVFLGAIGFGAWGWRQANAANTQLTTAIEEQSRKIESLRRSNPFPSSQNLDIVRQDFRTMESLYKELQTRSARPVSVPELIPVKFVSLLAQKQKALETLAGKAQVSIPSRRYPFGFENLGGKIPHAQDVYNLTKQLIVTEALCISLYESHIKELNDIKWASGSSSTNALFTTMAYDLKITTSTTNLRVFINKLQSLPWLFSIRSLTIEARPVSAAPSTPEMSGMMPRGMPVAPEDFGSPPGFQPELRPGAPPDIRPSSAPPPATPETEPKTPSLPANILTVTMSVDLVEPVPPPAPPTKTPGPSRP